MNERLQETLWPEQLSLDPSLKKYVVGASILFVIVCIGAIIRNPGKVPNEYMPQVIMTFGLLAVIGLFSWVVAYYGVKDRLPRTTEFDGETLIIDLTGQKKPITYEAAQIRWRHGDAKYDNYGPYLPNKPRIVLDIPPVRRVLTGVTVGESAESIKEWETVLRAAGVPEYRNPIHPKWIVPILIISFFVGGFIGYWIGIGYVLMGLANVPKAAVGYTVIPMCFLGAICVYSPLFEDRFHFRYQSNGFVDEIFLRSFGMVFFFGLITLPGGEYVITALNCVLHVVAITTSVLIANRIDWTVKPTGFEDSNMP